MASSDSKDKLPNYGAVADEENAKLDQAFDPSNTYYLQDQTRWTLKKILLVVVPILGAVLIVGGFALFLLRDFSHLYPGQNGDKSGYYAHGGEHVVPSSNGGGGDEEEIHAPLGPYSKHKEDSDYEDETSSKHHGSSGSSTTPSDAGATCAVHPDCSGLIGNCCPTTAGTFLECCKN